MNYKKLILVGLISAFVAILTSILGVAGTVIGSVISSVLYNMLSEALENPVSNATFNHDFEWEIAYVFPLVVIALIQLLLIFALIAEMGILPYGFVKFYLSIQNFANNNLYRILGIALLFISAYPLVLKPEFVKKEHGLLLVFVGLVFLARGFVDLGNPLTELYGPIFSHFDLPIAIVAFLIISFVIFRILILSKESENTSQAVNTVPPQKKVYKNTQEHFQNKEDDYVYVKPKKQNVRRYRPKRNRSENPQKVQNVRFRRDVQKNQGANDNAYQKGINKSSDKIHFESNDLLDEYKK
jgi:ABC-type multidrug transport system fused ATPase/permease subunit